MNKLIATFMALFFFGAILSGIMEGGGGITTTRITIDHTAAVVTLTVADTSGFLSSSHVIMGNEKIRYTGKTANTFTGCTRGYDGTEAVAHAAGAKVYSPDASVINSALGFNVASTGVSMGIIDIPIMIGKFFTITIPRLIMWDYSWLRDGSLQYLRYFLIVVSIGFLIYMAYYIASALGGILQGIFSRP